MSHHIVILYAFYSIDAAQQGNISTSKVPTYNTCWYCKCTTSVFRFIDISDEIPPFVFLKGSSGIGKTQAALALYWNWFNILRQIIILFTCIRLKKEEKRVTGYAFLINTLFYTFSLFPLSFLFSDPFSYYFIVVSSLSSTSSHTYYTSRGTLVVHVSTLVFLVFRNNNTFSCLQQYSFSSFFLTLLHYYCRCCCVCCLCRGDGLGCGWVVEWVCCME